MTGAPAGPASRDVISQRLQFIHLKEDGTAVDGGSAPYLDYRPTTAEECAAVAARDRPRLGCRRGSRIVRWVMPSPVSYRSISPR